jgi:arylsulfatase A-like enzyme
MVGTRNRCKRRGACAGLLLALVAVLLAAGCTRDAEKPPNLLLISVDTLRADRLGYAGETRPISPAIDRLAREGIVFPNAFSASGWTLPSMATILSGRYPKEHGAVTLESPLRDDLPTLATILKSRGYDTRGYVSHVVLESKYGFDRGFERFDVSVLGFGHPHRASTERQLTDRVIAELGDIREPFFLWVHYFGPHYDYLQHAPWSAFGDTAANRYDQEIAFTDSHIGRLLDELGRRDLDRNTVVVFTSDHGEEFGEHGGTLHYTLHDEVIRVPLIIRAPSLGAGSRPTVVEQVDLLPTILGLLGIAAEPGETFSGRDILSAASPARQGPVFIERDRPAPYRQTGVIDGRYKLVVIEKLPVDEPVRDDTVNVIPGIYLYDLEADPGETKNLYVEGEQRARALLAKLEQHFSSGGSDTQSIELDPEAREQLHKLGYAE